MDTKYTVKRNGDQIMIQRSDGITKYLCRDDIIEMHTEDASYVVKLGGLDDAELVGYAFGLPALKACY